MNERIKELIEQAEISRLEYNSATMMTERIQEFDKAKFAELIVKECMEWCDAHATIDGSAQQIRNSIKNHFGVE